MGGYGSTRWMTHIKAATVEDIPIALRIDSKLADTIRSGGGTYSYTWQWRAGWLGKPGESSITLLVVEGGQAVRLQYRAQTTGQEVDERVQIARRPLTYGQRLFWLCPGCNRRAAVLYFRGSVGMAGFLSRQPGRFRCRQCHGLTYKSAQEADKRVYALVRDIHNPAALPGDMPRAALDNGRDTLADLQGAFLLLKAYDIVMKRYKRQLKRLGVDTSDIPF